MRAADTSYANINNKPLELYLRATLSDGRWSACGKNRVRTAYYGTARAWGVHGPREPQLYAILPRWGRGSDPSILIFDSTVHVDVA